MSSPIDRILNHQQMQSWRADVRNAKRTVAFTNGCFDLIHRGHLEYLFAASKLADELVVAVNSDQSVRSLKRAESPSPIRARPCVRASKPSIRISSLHLRQHEM